MLHHLTKRFALLAVLGLLALAGCESEPTSGPDARPAPILGGLFEKPSSVTEEEASYTLIEGRIPNNILDLEVSSLIGVLGGTLSLAEHTITIPRGALDGPTLISMTMINNGYVEVDLWALEVSLLGGLINIGGQGFNKPVTLSLSYAWASNVEDEDDLFVLRLNGKYSSDRHEVLESTVDKRRKVVTVKLDHFSKYCLASS